MKKFQTLSDIGSVLVGTKDSAFAVPNGYGDGYTKVRICDEQEGEKLSDKGNFLSTFVGQSIHIYLYDCSERESKDIVETLSGRYAVYYGGDHHQGQVTFVKWE